MKPIRLLSALGLLLLLASPAPTAAGTLKEDLDRILRSGPLRGADLGALVLRTGADRPLYSVAAGRPLAPASNMKVLTSLAALQILGPEARLETEVFSASPPTAQGSLAGPLWVRGAGDPSLVGESWWLLAREIQLAGVRRVGGDLVADTSLFSGAQRPAGWPEGCGRPYCAPFDALMANFSSVEIRVAPGLRDGDRPRVGLFPLACGLEVENQARTVAGGRAALEVSITGGGDTGRVLMHGTVGSRASELRTYRNVPDAALYALGCLRDALQREGVAVDGGLRRGGVPAGAHLVARQRSRPLHQLVSDMNKYSNNVMAESLVRLLGSVGGGPGSTAAGLQRLQEHLERRGVDTAGWALADGSGLSRDGRITAAGLATALQQALQDPSLAPEMLSSLAVGGGTGTLAERLQGSGRRIRAKTGSIAGAASLAGYAYPTGGGPPLIFAFLLNGLPDDEGPARDALDRAAGRLLAVTP